MTGGKGSWIEKMAPVLMVLVIVMAFALGSLWSKVNYLEGGGETADAGSTTPTVAPPKYAKFTDAVTDLGKKAGLDTNKLLTCINSGEKAAVVEADFKLGQEVGVKGTPGYFVNGKFLGGAFPVDSFKELIDRELNGTGSRNYKDYEDTNLQGAGAQGVFKAEPTDVAVGGSAVNGSAGAKVTIVEFSDIQCPYCQRGHQNMQALKTEYGEKIRVVFKHFPLPQLHKHAQKAAESFECARVQDESKAWKLLDLYFTNQAELSKAS